MDRPVRWTEVAARQLERAAAYIEADSPAYAAAFVHKIREAAQTLGQFPSRGRFVPEFEGQSIRELIVRPYRLVYTVDDEAVSILALIHGARDFTRAWQNPES